MNDTVQKVLEITFVAVLVYLVSANWVGFTAVINAVGANSSNYVKTLQAR